MVSIHDFNSWLLIEGGDRGWLLSRSVIHEQVLVLFFAFALVFAEKFWTIILGMHNIPGKWVLTPTVERLHEPKTS